MDTALFLLINHGTANPLFDVLMPALTHRGYLLVLPFILYSVLRGAAARDGSGRRFLSAAIAAAALSCVAVLLADAVCGWIKDAVARPRPCVALEGVRLLVACPPSFSFPSSHAATSFAFILPYFLLTRRFLAPGWLAFLLLLAAAIAFSRPYLGVHYPSDVLGGALLGSGVAWVMCHGYDFLVK
jgi:undecaprenyl-diphosphatase